MFLMTHKILKVYFSEQSVDGDIPHLVQNPIVALSPSPLSLICVLFFSALIGKTISLWNGMVFDRSRLTFLFAILAAPEENPPLSAIAGLLPFGPFFLLQFFRFVNNYLKDKGVRIYARTCVMVIVFYL